MKLPNGLKIVWWLVITSLIALVLYLRSNDILNGDAQAFDIFIFLIFVALMLVPVFPDVEFFGIKLKQQIEELKHDISIKLGDIKNEVKMHQVQTFNIQGYAPPPTDQELPKLVEEVESLSPQEPKGSEFVPIELIVPDANVELFKVRYAIEIKVRALYRNYGADDVLGGRHGNLTSNARYLASKGLFDSRFSHILNETMSICNYAIHGENVSDAQAQFVLSNSKTIIEYLDNILDKLKSF